MVTENKRKILYNNNNKIYNIIPLIINKDSIEN